MYLKVSPSTDGSDDPLIVGNQCLSGVQGHGLLWRYLKQAGMPAAGWDEGLGQRIGAWVMRRFLSRAAGNSPSVAWNLFCADLAGGKRRPVHLIWGDDCIDRAAWPEHCVFTLHQPLELWSEERWARIGRSRGILTMAQREADAIGARHPRLPVAFIPHGIDSQFWHPDPTRVQTTPKLIAVVGRYMRNFEMLLRVAKEILRRRTDVRFRWLVNPDFQIPPNVAALLPAQRFEVVRQLSAGQLRTYYQESWLFFTPYDNVTASNAIVEAMACGTPILTTRVGGMSSYLSDDAGILVDNDDDAGMIAHLNRVLDDRHLRETLAHKARLAAAERFCWEEVTESHLEFYKGLSVPVPNRVARQLILKSGREIRSAET